MRHKTKVAAIAAAAVIAVSGIAATAWAVSGHHPSAVRSARTTRAAAAAPAASCPAVLHAVSDVARKAHINIADGSMTAHVVRSEELAWSGELLGSWKQSANPTAADVRLGQDVLIASTGLPLRGNADAVKFIAELRKLQADCA